MIGIGLQIYGKIVDKADSPKSYLVRINRWNTNSLRRNYWHLIPAPLERNIDLDGRDDSPFVFEKTKKNQTGETNQSTQIRQQKVNEEKRDNAANQTQEEDSSELDDLHDGEASTSTPKISSRVSRLPKYLKDFYVGKH